MQKCKLLVAASSLTVALLGLSAEAAAQQPVAQAATPAASDTGDDQSTGADIIVTAQRRSERINDVPMSIQAFSGDRLQDAGVTSPEGLTQVTTGLNFARSPGNTPIYTMRGIGFNTPNLSSTSPVGIYYDEVSYAYPYLANGPMFDIERVEVLKGPQGTLYGRNTTGGLINFIAAKPGDQLQAGFKAELGNYETYNFEGYVSTPLGDGAGLRISGRWENSDKGWQYSATRGERLGEKDRLGLRAILALKPSDRLSIDLTASYWRDKSDTTASQAVAFQPVSPPFAVPGGAGLVRTTWDAGQADWDPATAGKPAFVADARFFGLAARVSYELNDTLSLISLTGYNDVRRNDFTDVDGTPSEIFAYASIGRIKSLSQELRLVGSSDTVNYTIGAYYSRDKIQDDQVGYFDRSSVLRQLRFVASLVDPLNVRYSAAQKATGMRNYQTTTDQVSRSASIFANGDIALTDQLKLSGGLRYTDDQLKFSACTRDYNGNTLPVWNTAVPFAIFLRTGKIAPGNVAANECLTYNADFSAVASNQRPTLNEDNLAGRLALNYQPNRDTLLYATIGRGYKSGAVPILAANVETQLEPARQERVTAYELGAKLDLADGLLHVNFAGFYMDYKDKQLFSQVPDIVFGALARIVNVPKSEVYGGEVELSVRPARGVTFNVGASYTHTKVTQFVGFDRQGAVFNYAGASFPYTPEWQVNGGVNLEQPITGTLGVQANINANYQSRTTSDLAGQAGFEVKGYTVVNATLGLFTLDDRWKVGVYARNLFNENYWTGTNKVTDTIFRMPGMTRAYGLSVAWKY